MKMWMRKALVALFTIATFGLVSPPAALMADKPSEHQNIKETGYTAVYENREESLADGEQAPKPSSFDAYTEELLNKAEDQSLPSSGTEYRLSLKTNTEKKFCRRSKRRSSAI